VNENVKNINATINKMTQLDNLQKKEYLENAIEKMVDWGVQKQVTWAVLIFTFATLFFMVLFEMRQILLNNDQKKKPDFYILFIAIAGIIFSMCAYFSIFMLIYHYEYVAYLEKELPISTFSPLFCFIDCIPVILFIGFLILGIVSLIKALNEK
jgi:magnesium-transporting ATPase (P-type)